MSSPVDLRNPGRKLHVGVILLNSVTEYLDIGPVDFLAGVSRECTKDMEGPFLAAEFKAQALDIQFHWVTETGDASGRMTGGLRGPNVSNFQDSFVSCPPLDIVIQGATIGGYKVSETEKAFLRENSDCPPPVLPLLTQTAPGVNWVDKRWAQGGKIWTTGTLLCGLDMVVAFARQTWGGEGSLVERVIEMGEWPQRGVEYEK
ncbi:hypothetical protein N7468_003048 [Penicillium chermesinum]|uniref:Uncharacterized protein n=1 Tax=Penicillium chermesinum TaxID=63820 RepID=A0A9W9P5Q3_9EURO|nr:uncharacterized protein N7468_003048 [Penicillium chermesinum]KAJ5238429.1 hypothetical protein N7468_003048 [Penicillium chermesinum]